MLQRLSQALSCFPKLFQRETDKLTIGQQERIEEYRLRIGHPPKVMITGEERILYSEPLTASQLEEIVLQATGQAVYSASQMLKNGFLILRGGHRLGLCGTVVYKEGKISALKEISSLNLRIASERTGFAQPLIHHLWTHPGSVLIVSPPGWGKTTLLRDLIFQLSTRFLWRISVCDERMELAACKDGVPQFDLGPSTDILSGAQKETGIEMLLRTMNPQWIAVDEITSEQDVIAILRASYCGVQFLATAHAMNEEELYARPIYGDLLSAGIFRNLILIKRNRELQIKELMYHD